MKKLFGILILSTLTISLFAQDFSVPNNYIMKQKEDYKKYEGDVLKAIDWLIQTPVDDQKEKRLEVNRFFIVWLTGTPDISLEIKSEIITFSKKNPELLVIFMGGWTKYALESGDNNKLTGNLKGVEAVIDFYQKNKKALKKDKNVQQYIEMKEKGQLADYISKNA